MFTSILFYSILFLFLFLFLFYFYFYSIQIIFYSNSNSNSNSILFYSIFFVRELGTTSDMNPFL